MLCSHDEDSKVQKQYEARYSAFPEYHLYYHPEMPSWESLIEARYRWLEENPRLVVVGAHPGSMGHDVGVVAERLDRYPNFFVDTAARSGDMTSQNSDTVSADRLRDRPGYG